jgi:hypothetical protein
MQATSPISLVRALATLAPVAILCVLAYGCSKPSSTDPLPLPAPAGEGTPSAVPAVAPAAPSASVTTAGSSSASASSPALAAHGAVVPSSSLAGASPYAAVTPSALPSASAAPSPAPSAAPTYVQYATTSAGGNHFSVAVSARTECPVGTDCAGTITLTASGGYHINDEYPYRFVVDAAPGVEWLAADGKGFGKSSGDFTKTAPVVAQLALRYKGKQAGPVRLSGTYKMSVCSEANCQVETVPLAVNVTFR